MDNKIMLDEKIKLLILDQKEEIKNNQRQLLLKHGNKYDITNFLVSVFRKMMDNSLEDYNSFIELEKDYVECNQKLISMGIKTKEIFESR